MSKAAGFIKVKQINTNLSFVYNEDKNETI
mgnify:CR=1 FL=1